MVINHIVIGTKIKPEINNIKYLENPKILVN